MTMPTRHPLLLLLVVSAFSTGCDGEAVVDDTQSPTAPLAAPTEPADDPMNPGEDPMGEDPVGEDPMGEDPMGPMEPDDVCETGFVGGGVYADVSHPDGRPVAFAWTTDNCALELSDFSIDFSLGYEPVVQILEEDGTVVSRADLEPRLYDNELVVLDMIALTAGDVPIGPHLGQTVEIVDLIAPDATYIRGTLWAP